MNKFLRAAGLLILVLVLTATGIKLFLDYRIDDLLRSRISAQLGDDYDFDYRKTRLRLISNDFRILDVQIDRTDGDSLLWHFKVDQIRLTGFKPLAFINDGVLAADSISILEPRLNVFEINLQPREDRAFKNTEESEPLKFRLEHIALRNADLLYDPRGPEILRSGLNLDIRGINFRGNILNMADSLASLELNLPEIHYTTPDSVYSLYADNLNISKVDSLVRIDSFRLDNNISVTEFSRFMHWRKSLFDISVPQISMKIPQVYQDSIWSVDRINLAQPDIVIMKDQRFPLPDRHTELPQQQLMDLALKFTVDSIQLIDANIELLTRISGSSTSDLVISDVNGSISGLQNFNFEKPAYVLVADGNLMQKAPLHAEIQYLYGGNNPFTLWGVVDDVNLKFIDHFLRKQAGIAVAGGSLDGLRFNMSGDHNGISGQVECRYHGLKIHLVDKETDEEKVLLNFLSDSAGRLFFYRENPHKGKLRKGRFYVERDVRKGFISQWVEGLMQGIVNNITKKEINLKKAGNSGSS